MIDMDAVARSVVKDSDDDVFYALANVPYSLKVQVPQIVDTFPDITQAFGDAAAADLIEFLAGQRDQTTGIAKSWHVFLSCWLRHGICFQSGLVFFLRAGSLYP
jgi:hypothetical protein